MADLEPREPYNAADPKQVAKQQRAAARHDKAMQAVVQGVMSTTDGRAWIWDYLTFCQIYGNQFVPGQPDHTAFLLGAANVGKKLLADVQRASPENYLLMAKENAS